MIGRIPVLDVRPQVDCGRRPAKAVVGETFEVSATVFREGHDAVAANVVLRDPAGRCGPWTPMREPQPGTDRWGAEVTPTAKGRWTYTVEAWSDPVATWRQHRRASRSRRASTPSWCSPRAPRCYERAAADVPKSDGREAVLGAVDALRDDQLPAAARLAAALAPEVTDALDRHPLRELVTVSRPMPLLVERRARPVRLLVRALPALRGRRAPPTGRHAPSAAPCAPPPTGCPRSPRWASTWSTCRRSTPSAPPSARAPTTPCTPAPTTSARPGRSAPPRAATTPSTRTWAPSTTSTTSCGRARDLRMEVALDFALQCSPDHPWVDRAPRVVPPPRGRLHRLRREPAEEVPGHLPARLRRRLRAGWSAETLRLLRLLDGHGRTDLPRRQPAHQAGGLLGEGHRRHQPHRPRRDLPGRGVHPPAR